MSALTRPLAFEPRLFGASAVLFVVSAAITIATCLSMSAMDMAMPGGWTMSMAWMRMPDQTWSGAAASFLGAWIAMMVAMMLPALVPMLRRYAQAVARVDEASIGRQIAIAGAGYFAVWAAVGMALFPVGTALATLAMAQPAAGRVVPLAVAAGVLLTGVYQLSPAKIRALACCGAAPDPASTRSRAAAWRHGLGLGARCVRCCGNLMTVLVVVGVMDLTTMALVTAGITAERLAPAGDRVARAIGAGLVAVGLAALVRAAITA